jgi:hypothetical protein
MKLNHLMKTFLAVLFCGLFVCGQAFGITAAEDLDGQLEIRPSAPTSSWPESGDSNELAPNYTATISVTVVESEEVGGVNYTLSSGPDATTGSSDPNVVWTESGTTFSITNTAADTASATMTLTCIWSPERGDGGGEGPGPEDIHGQADADVQLLDSVVDWVIEKNWRQADADNELEFEVIVTDDNGFGIENWTLSELTPVDSNPEDPNWIFTAQASSGPAWMLSATVKSGTPSTGKIKISYDDGSEEEVISDEQIGFLPTTLELTEDNLWFFQDGLGNEQKKTFMYVFYDQSFHFLISEEDREFRIKGVSNRAVFSNNQQSDYLLEGSTVNGAAFESVNWTPRNNTLRIELWVDGEYVAESEAFEVLAPVKGRQIASDFTSGSVGVWSWYESYYEFEVLDQNDDPVDYTMMAEAFDPPPGSFTVVFPDSDWNEGGFDAGNIETDGNGRFADVYGQQRSTASTPTVVAHNGQYNAVPVLQTNQTWKCGGDGEPGISNTGFTVFDWTLVFGRGRAWHTP